jgi:hypothetical protein
VGDDLLALSQRYVQLHDEIASVRQRIKIAVLNGAATERPVRPPTRRPSGPPTGQKLEEVMAEAKSSEDLIVEAMKAGPQRHASLARVLNAKPTTLSLRLFKARRQGRRGHRRAPCPERAQAA